MKLELQGMTKRFGPVVANDSISLVVEPGQIHALLGENGAGKSTLMNLLYGLYQPDEGRIVLDGAEQSFSGPGDAMDAGIGMVHQHFMLVPVFSVAENVILGNEPSTRWGSLDLATARERVREISARFGFDIDPDATIEDLPVGIQQRVEGSFPRTTFSATLKTGTNMKCWWTMPIPASMASPGPENDCSAPSRTMRPSSG